MSDISDKLTHPGQVNILRCDLISHNGLSTDLTAIMQSLTLYEDLFSNTMSGQIMIQDALELVSTLPIIGQETLVIELQTPSFTKKISKTFYVYKMESRRTKKRSQTYILDFCSNELISSINTKISKSFSGTLSDTVKTLVTGDKYLASEKSLVLDETKNSIQFIAPYWSPLKTINWCAERAINKRGVANYLFYETNQAFEFCSIDTLVHTGTTRKYTLADVDSRTQAPDDFETQFSSVDSINTDVAFDYMKNVSAGMYGSSLYTFDLTTKSIENTKYEYLRDFDKSYHLEKYPLQTLDLLKKNQASTHHIAKNNYLHGTRQPMLFGEAFQQRNSLLQQINAFKFDITVFGRTDAKIGEVIEFAMPELREITADQINSTSSKMFSGRYIISAIKHTIVQGNHSMDMEITSDSFVKALT